MGQYKFLLICRAVQVSVDLWGSTSFSAALALNHCCQTALLGVFLGGGGKPATDMAPHEFTHSFKFMHMITRGSKQSEMSLLSVNKALLLKKKSVPKIFEWSKTFFCYLPPGLHISGKFSTHS